MTKTEHNRVLSSASPRYRADQRDTKTTAGMTFRLLRLHLVVACTAAAGIAWGSNAHASNCERLKGLRLSNAAITVAQTVPRGAFIPPSRALPPGVPEPAYGSLQAFCRVGGTIRPTRDSDIRFEVWMPFDAWNGNFVGVGNGVWAGSISYFAMVEPLLRGYATAATDDGHQGDPLDAGFAAGHPQKLIDFGYRAPHLMTVDAKATITAFYNKPAAHSLFVSCSTGGRQGLMEAYRYPYDYDGISATAPANPMTALMIGSLWTGYAALKSPARTIPPSKFAMIHQAVIEACDAKDGVKDGIVSAPERCHFDPSTLQCPGNDAPSCLTAAQVETLRDIYRGPSNARTGHQIYPGFELGSESQFALLTAGPEPFRVATSYMRDLVFANPSWDFRTFDYDRDVQRVVQFGESALDVPASGLDAYFKKGGKLLLSHGLADGLIPPKATQQFYAALAARLGRESAARGVRLFMVPGMGHCGGGDGPSVMDLLGAIDAWVDTGHAPEQIIASNSPNAPARSRPVCPHPQEAVYTGGGSADHAENFKCQVRSGPADQ